MPVHHGADLLYQIAINSAGIGGKIATTNVGSGPPAVIAALDTALATYGNAGETVSARPVTLTTITASSGTYTYYGAVSTAGRSAIYVNNDTYPEDPWLLGPGIGVFPTS